MSAVIGFVIGFSMVLALIRATRKTTLTIFMDPTLAVVLLVLTIAMCGVAALSAIMKVTRIDPAGVFSR
jgi:putative ABC transport system permease protein